MAGKAEGLRQVEQVRVYVQLVARFQEELDLALGADREHFRFGEWQFHREATLFVEGGFDGDGRMVDGRLRVLAENVAALRSIG